MRYCEFVPTPVLRDIVSVVWTIAGEIRSGESYRYHVVPDACSDLVFDRLAGEGYIFGTVSDARMVDTVGRVSLIGVRLQPHLLPAYTRVPACQMRNLEVSFKEASLGTMNDLFESVIGDGNGDFGIREAQYLAEVVARMLRPERINIRALWLTRALLASDGSVAGAANTTGFSTRQLQRIAEQELGLPPKRLGRILRLQRSFPGVLAGRSPFTRVAVDHGYADQAHMIREFSTLTGYPPGFWRSRRMSDLYNQPGCQDR